MYLDFIIKTIDGFQSAKVQKNRKFFTMYWKNLRNFDKFSLCYFLSISRRTLSRILVR